MKTIPTEQKWREVDNLINNINRRRANGEVACLTGLDEYLDHNFNPERNNKEDVKRVD
jgi:hypothetical protein